MATSMIIAGKIYKKWNLQNMLHITLESQSDMEQLPDITENADAIYVNQLKTLMCEGID